MRTASNLGKLCVLLLILVSGCSFEKLNFSVDKGLLDPTTTAAEATKVAPTVAH
jgi:hypothetical protein